jgi:DNA-binding MurR/RpiR family transcriptional regulator
MAASRKGKRRRLYESAVAAMLSSKNVTEAAEACGISYSTLNRWQQEPEFQKLYSDAKRDILESVKNNLRQLGMKAVGTLSNTIDAPFEDTSNRLNASKFIISKLLDMELTDDLAARIAAIEGGNGDEPGE